MTDWEKRARELLVEKRRQHDDHVPYADWPVVEMALQLGREMADERAEEIARRIEISGVSHPTDKEWTLTSVWTRCVERTADIARSTIQKPKTRERVLEEALREIHNSHASQFCADIARRALEWTAAPEWRTAPRGGASQEKP